MTEPVSLAHRCDQCAYVDYTPGVHPMRCKHPQLRHSIAAGLMRSESGACGPEAILWLQKERYAPNPDSPRSTL